MTDTITLPRATVQQALEALEELDGLDTETECVTIDVGDVMDALRAALEQQAEALQAMNDLLTTGTSVMLDGKRVDPASIYKQAEPVGTLEAAIASEPTALIHKWRVLELIKYYAPQQQAEPVAWPQLSDDMEYAAQDEFHILPPRMKRLWKRMQELYTAPPQRKPLTDEQADQIISGLQTCHHQSSKREFLKVWLRDWAAHGIKEGT